MKRLRLIREFRALSALGLHVYPVGSDKLPLGKWAKGTVNWVETKADDEQGQLWAADRFTEGWAVLCGNKTVGVFTLDVESAGTAYPEIQAVLAELPSTCKRPSPSGGEHAVIFVTDGDPVPTQILARANGVLLAEVRGVSKGDKNGAYAVVTGPGRGDLPEDFEPVRMTRAEVDELLDAIRVLHRPSPREVRVRRNKRRSAYAGSQTGIGGGTGRIITDAVLSGELSWMHILEDGWALTSDETVDDSHRIGLLRPAYDGAAPTSRESANAFGATLVVHSSAVEWADPGEGFNPQQALAASRFDGDYAAAMRAVEGAADAYVTGRGLVPAWISRWPGTVLESVHRARQRSLLEWRDRKGGSLS